MATIIRISVTSLDINVQSINKPSKSLDKMYPLHTFPSMKTDIGLGLLCSFLRIRSLISTARRGDCSYYKHWNITLTLCATNFIPFFFIQHSYFYINFLFHQCYITSIHHTIVIFIQQGNKNINKGWTWKSGRQIQKFICMQYDPGVNWCGWLVLKIFLCAHSDVSLVSAHTVMCHWLVQMQAFHGSIQSDAVWHT